MGNIFICAQGATVLEAFSHLACIGMVFDSTLLEMLVLSLCLVKTVAAYSHSSAGLLLLLLLPTLARR
jgi:hypothetical protein